MLTPLAAIELIGLEIPFRTSFRHASAVRSTTETVISVAHAVNSAVGHGEGCPRNYVTGESVATCLQFLDRHRASIRAIDGVEALRDWQLTHEKLIDQNPAAWCAIETSLLDLFAKCEGCSVESLLQLPELHGAFEYTAVLGIAEPESFAAQLTQYLQLGFADFKIKISGEYARDRHNLHLVRQSNTAARIRIDANNHWSDANEAIAYVSALGNDFWAVEEPLQRGDYPGLERFAKSLSCQIVLDESFCRLGQFVHIRPNPRVWIPNIRISKMGGLLRSLAVAEQCRRDNVPFILGAQVGETSVLTRVALSLANSFRTSLLCQEGAFGVHLLSRDVTDAPIQFGQSGMVTVPLEMRPGWGIDWNLS